MVGRIPAGLGSRERHDLGYELEANGRITNPHTAGALRDDNGVSQDKVRKTIETQQASQRARHEN